MRATGAFGELGARLCRSGTVNVAWMERSVRSVIQVPPAGRNDDHGRNNFRTHYEPSSYQMVSSSEIAHSLVSLVTRGAR